MADATRPMTYHAFHATLQQQRGRARRLACIDCGGPARDWSYDHQDRDETEDSAGRQYSLDVTHYAPRCKSCHRYFDMAHRAVEREHHRAALEAIAAPIEDEIRQAIAAQKDARRRNDQAALDYWDDQLERLTAPLRKHGVPHARR